jgi:hypothetical protein
MSDHHELNTVGELIDFLKRYPSDYGIDLTDGITDKRYEFYGMGFGSGRDVVLGIWEKT